MKDRDQCDYAPVQSPMKVVTMTPTPVAAVPLDSMLGNLQNDMNKFGVDTVAKGCCYCCRKPIVGQVS